ncbi:glycosyltransferase [Bifidobacterium tibiigranuli]|jgi:glycosyltransferase involved in cell wall biosynthesis|uniref:glycosyltransferase n=1 Tax=Bifidobacterium tibiigranuli TaxID=2172043 RepID=UPI0023544C78|nr:glycosyltransferase [Bifidobacterium tibiigranuli]MCI1210902.1 glycosyltransferase [Bifidobacterium tibiigranuli]MCI1220531.1 glycosyltransferase [Bifidobacterium tibiigranuli]
MSNAAELISVIVPVYNVESFLSQCLDSLYKQTYDNYEVIIVDDGSTDHSKKICDRYAIQCPQFTVYHTQNRGLSAARNFGVAHSHGKYLLFVDSDDLIVPDTLERASSFLKMSIQSNLVIFTYQRIDENGKKIDSDTESKSFPKTATVSSYDALYYLLEDRFNNFSWRILFDKSIWVDNNISFPEGLLYEDIRTTYRLLLGAQKVIFLNEQLYLYRQRKNSIIHRAEAHSIEESRAAIFDRNAFLHDKFPEFDKICDANIYKWHYGVLMNPDYALSNDSEVQHLIKCANAYIRKTKKPKHLKHMLNWEQKLCLFIIQCGGHGLLIVLVSFLKRLRTTLNRIVIN